MDRGRMCGGRALGIAIVAALVMMAGGAGAATEISSCTTISAPGEYVLNQSIVDSSAGTCINIVSSNVIFDGAGYTIDGVHNQLGYGVYVHNSATTLTNVTVKNVIAINWGYGVYYYDTAKGSITNNNVRLNAVIGILLFLSNNNTLSGNNASNNQYGIDVENSNNNTLSGNNANLNSYSGIILGNSNNNMLIDNYASNASSYYNYGIELFYSSNNTLTDNIMIGNKNNFDVEGSFDNEIDTSNIVDGKNIYYIKDAANTVYNSSTNAGTFYCIRCINVTMKDMSLNKNSRGIFLWKTTLSRIQNVDASNNDYGIFLSSSSNNTLSGNNANSNLYTGILLDSSSNNTLSGNNASNNYWYGISLSSSSNNTLSANNASNSCYGYYGIYLGSSSNNTLIGNNVNSCYGYYGIYLGSSSHNTIYLNSFTNNYWNGYSFNSTNIWNSPQPITYIHNGSEHVNKLGNYWSDYTGSDSNGDGIGDTAYSIDGDADYYPLMQPFEIYSQTPSTTELIMNETASSTHTLFETIISQNATLNTSIKGDFNATLNFTDLEFVFINSGSFAGKGFSKGNWSTNIEGNPYDGYWEGISFKNHEERKIYLKGMVSGGLKGIVDGYLIESVNGSGIYDRYQAEWTLSQIGADIVFAKVDLNGTVNYQESAEYSSELYALQTSIEGKASGYYNGSLSIVLTHVRIDNETNPYYGEGFSIISYISEYGSGEGWTHDILVSPGRVEMKGLFTSPLMGIVSATLDETKTPRTLSVAVERIDIGLPPAPDLKVNVWGPGRVSPGQTVDYIIEYRNDGVKEAKDVELVMELPLEVNYLSSSVGGTFNEGLYGIIWYIGAIPPKKSGYVSSKIITNWGLPSGTEIENIVRIAENRISIESDPNVIVKYGLTDAIDDQLKFIANISNQSEDEIIAIDTNFTEVPNEFPLLLEYNESPNEVEFITNMTIKGSILENRNVMKISKKYFDRTKALFDSSKDMMDFNKERKERERFYEWLVQNDKINLEDKELLSKNNWGIMAMRGLISGFAKFADANLKPPSKWFAKPYGDYFQQFIRKSLPGIDRFVGAAIYRHKEGYLPDGWEKSIIWTTEFEKLYKEAKWEYNTPELWSAEHFRNKSIKSHKIQISVARDPNIKYGPEGFVLPGQKLNYTVEFENEGEGIAFGVYFTDTLDEDLDASTLQIGPVISTIDGSIIAPAGTYNPSTRTITWLVGEVGPGTGGYANLSVNVRSNAEEGTEIINYATVYFPSVPETTRTNGIVSVVDITPPRYSNVSQNKSEVTAGETNEVYAYWQDGVQLNYTWLETNESGTWQNASYLKLSGNEAWSIFTINTTQKGATCWRIHANDTAGNENVTSTLCFEITYTPTLPIHNIDKGTNYTTIQAAIDDASPGDEIHVDSGTYYENVNITKQLILRGIDTGIGAPVVDAGNKGSAITIFADGSVLEGFNAKNASLTWPNAGIIVFSNDNLIKSNIANNNRFGISILSSNNNTITGNNASDNILYGILLKNSSYSIVENNTADINTGEELEKNGNLAVGTGIVISGSHNIIKNNEVKNNLFGMHINSSNNNTVKGNIATSNNFYGIVLVNSSYNDVENNIANNHTGFSSNGTSGVPPSSTGIMILGSNNIVKNNNASYNYIGIGIFGGGPGGDIKSSYNIIENNTVLNNTIPELKGKDLMTGGIIIAGTSNDILKNNSLQSNIFGIGMIDSNNTTVSENLLTINGIGILLKTTSNSILKTNKIYNNVIGMVLLENSRYNDLSNNTIYKNAGYGGPGEVFGWGIGIMNSDNNKISSNNISENWYGIFLTNSSYNAINNNTASNNTGFNGSGNALPSSGIIFSNSSSHNEIRNNRLSHNEFGIYLFSTSNNVLSGNTASSNNRSGILLLNSSYSRVENNIANNNKGFEGDMWHGQPPSTGIEILGSHNIIRNNEASNNFVGIGISIREYAGDMVLVNNTVEENIIKNNTGISDVPSSGILVGSDNNVLRNNTILNNLAGIILWSNNNNVSNNTVSNNSGSGIYLAWSSNNTLTNNIMTRNNLNFGLSGVNDSHLDNNIDTSNLVNGKPIYYIKGAANTVYDFSTNAGTFYCIKCVNVTIKDMDLKSSEVGVLFWKTTRSRIQNVSVSNTAVGIALLNSSSNTIRNNIAYNNSYGIHLGNRSSYNEISENDVYNNNNGIALTVFHITQIASNQYNTIKNNNIFSNRNSGIILWISDNNKVYHNNIQNNSIQASDVGNANTWDDGYPSGGNYWSDYSGIDANNDSIGDTPYNISGGAGAQDKYPFMRANGWLQFENVTSFPGMNLPPTDPNGDGLYEDINGNGRKDFNDVVLFFNNLEWIPDHEPVSAFDFNDNGRVDFADIVRLFDEI